MAVIGYVGLPRTGKTLALIKRGVDAIERDNWDVYASFELGDRYPGFIVPRCPHFPDRPIACWFGLHQDHRRTHETFFVADRDNDHLGIAMYHDAGFRRGEGFIRYPHLNRLTSWKQVEAIRQYRDEFDAPHRLRLAFGGLDENGDERWTAEPTCHPWRCKGCSNGILILLDELNAWAPSREFAKLGMGVLTRFAYSGKDGLTICWSAQDKARIDKAIREVTDEIWQCTSFGGKITFRGRQLLQYQVFTRRRWIPGLMTERGMALDDEHVGVSRSGGMFDIRDSERDYWWTMKRYARHYRTFERIEALAHLLTPAITAHPATASRSPGTRRTG